MYYIRNTIAYSKNIRAEHPFPLNHRSHSKTEYKYIHQTMYLHLISKQFYLNNFEFEIPRSFNARRKTSKILTRKTQPIPHHKIFKTRPIKHALSADQQNLYRSQPAHVTQVTND